MRLAFYPSNTDPVSTSLDVEWGELADLLCEHEITDCNPCAGKDCPAKFGRAWSPVLIEGTRADAHVKAITVAVFDLDRLDDALLLRVAEAIEGFEYVFHSTHSPQCYRLVMPLSRDVQPGEWRTFLSTIVGEAGFDFPIALPCAACKARKPCLNWKVCTGNCKNCKAAKPCEDPAHCMRGTDRSCKDLSRLYFLPTCPRGLEPLAVRGSGASLDVDAILALAGASTRERARVSMPVEDDDPTDIDIGDLRTCVSNARKRKAKSINPLDAERYAILGRILQGEPLAVPGARDNTINQACAMLAFAFPAGTPTDAALEVLRPSLSAMQTDPEGFEHWQTRASQSYARASDRRAERDARAAEDDAKIRARMLASAQRASARESTPVVIATATTVEPGEDDESWKTQLIMRADLMPKSCGQNAVTILQYSPETRGTIRWNEVEKVIDIRGGPFENVPIDVLDIAVTDWFMAQWGMSLSVSEVGQRIMRVAKMNAYDPLKDYLGGLRWDGQVRSATFLEHYFGAAMKDTHGRDLSNYLRIVGQRWLVSAVARALQPGCKVDTVLVLEGDQGIRKTSALEVLGGPFFCDTQMVLGDKDTMMLAASSWIVELAELASFKKTEKEAQKAFLTRRRDKFRPPYGRVMVTCPRRCVWVATVNPDEGGYLVDNTGNRRYWPVLCDGIDIPGLERDRDQIWAEAVALLQQGLQWWFDKQEQKFADLQTEERMGENLFEAKVGEWWYSQHPSKRPALVTTYEVAETVLRLPIEKVAIMRSIQTDIGVALRRLGFRATRKTVNGRANARCYEPSEAMREAPQGGRPMHLRLIAAAKPESETG